MSRSSLGSASLGIRMLGDGGSSSALTASDQLVQAVLARDAVALESPAAPEEDPNETHHLVEGLLGRPLVRLLRSRHLTPEPALEPVPCG